MNIETKTYYTRGGLPRVQIIVKTPGDQVVATSNIMQVGDVEITETAFNTLVDTIESDKQARRVASNAALQVHIDSAKIKLLGLGLTNDEANAVLRTT